MKARYYDERIGRFLSNDPVGFSTGSPMMFNRYAYANNNPYKYTDPDGEFAQYVGAAVAVAGGALTLYEAYGAYQSGGSSAVIGSLVTGAAATAAGAKIASSLAKALAKLRSNTGINVSEVADAVGDVTKGGPKAGGGGTLDKLTPGEKKRIQNAANRSGQDVTVVGSRVNPNKALHPNTDYDFVINANNKTRNNLSRSLPGAKNVQEGLPNNQVIFRSPIDTTKPHVTFSPE